MIMRPNRRAAHDAPLVVFLGHDRAAEPHDDGGSKDPQPP
jgi:hypothetical protein